MKYLLALLVIATLLISPSIYDTMSVVNAVSDNTHETSIQIVGHGSSSGGGSSSGSSSGGSSSGGSSSGGSSSGGSSSGGSSSGGSSSGGSSSGGSSSGGSSSGGSSSGGSSSGGSSSGGSSSGGSSSGGSSSGGSSSGGSSSGGSSSGGSSCGGSSSGGSSSGGSSSGGGGGGVGNGGLTPMCPFCQALAYEGKQINLEKGKHWLFGFETATYVLRCDSCGYTTERDGMGNISNSVTKEAQAEWGARKWSTYFPGIIKFVPWFK